MSSAQVYPQLPPNSSRPKPQTPHGQGRYHHPDIISNNNARFRPQPPQERQQPKRKQAPPQSSFGNKNTVQIQRQPPQNLKQNGPSTDRQRGPTRPLQQQQSNSPQLNNKGPPPIQGLNRGHSQNKGHPSPQQKGLNRSPSQNRGPPPQVVRGPARKSPPMSNLPMPPPMAMSHQNVKKYEQNYIGPEPTTEIAAFRAFVKHKEMARQDMPPALNRKMSVGSSTTEEGRATPTGSEVSVDSMDLSDVTAISKGSKGSRSPRVSPLQPTYQQSRLNSPPIQVRPEVIVSLPEPESIPNLILPVPPTDVEKKMYLQTKSGPLLANLILSFLALTTGMWLFTLANPAFYIFGALNVYFTFYLIASYATGMYGKDFDYNGHLKLLEKPLDYYPWVDIYLPICGEPMIVLNNTWTHIKALNYPKFKVWVLDDGAKDECRDMAKSFGFNYIRRPDRPYLKKAGNLRYAFTQTKGSYYVIFDADFVPRPEMVTEMVVHMLHDSKIAVVQTPQFFRVSKNQTWVEQGAGIIQELFYRVIQTKRNRLGGSICVGTSAMYRREALLPFGGCAEMDHSEDIFTGMQCIKDGWKIEYVPVNLSMGICPNDLPSFFNQQYRWANGSLELFTSSSFWSSNMTFAQKMCYICGMLYYIASFFDQIMATIPTILLLIFLPQMVQWYNIIFVIPSLMISTVVLGLWTRHRYTMDLLKIQLVQSYSHIIAMKDHVFKTSLKWVPSGSGKEASKNTRYAQARAFCAFYTVTTVTAIVGLCFWRSIEYPFINFVPSLLLAFLQLYVAFQFMMGWSN